MMRTFILFEDLLHRCKLVLYFLVFLLRRRIVDNTARSLRVRVIAIDKHRAQRKRKRAVAVETEMSHATAIRAARFRLIFVYDLDGFDLRRTRHRACGEIGGECGEHVFTRTDRARYFTRDVLHVTELLHTHEVFDAHRPELCDLADVVPVEIDEHCVLRAFLRIIHKLASKLLVLLLVLPAAYGASKRSRRHFTVS